MRHLKYVCVLTLLAGLSTAQGQGSRVASLFVSAADGKDAWSGRLPGPNPEGTDGPLASMDGARRKVESLSKAGLAEVDVQFRGGTYTLAQPVMFGQVDTGTPATEIVYENFPGEQPVFSGGVRVGGWVNTGGNTWLASLPATTANFENLYYNGQRRLRARVGGTVLGHYFRTFKTVYLDHQELPGCPHEDMVASDPHAGQYECFDRFDYDPAADNNNPYAAPWSNLAASAKNQCGQTPGDKALQGEIEILVFEQFSTSKLRVSCVDPSMNRVYLTGPTATPPPDTASGVGFIETNRYVVENVANALTAPGQWYLDRKTTPASPNWTLTYLAEPGEDPNRDEVVAPQAAQLVVASGISYVTFRGLTFEHDNYTIPAAGYISMELEPDIAAAVSIQNSNHVTFDGVTMREIAGTGLGLIECITPTDASNAPAPECNGLTAASPDVSHNVVENSAFYDLGAMGIRIGEPYVSTNEDGNVPNSTTVENNVVEGYGRTIPASFGIGQGFGHNNLYTHNDVYDGYHCAISLTDNTGGDGRPNGIGEANNIISFNHVYNLLEGIMNDGGSIRVASGNLQYTAPGNRVLNNKIHDVTDASIMDSNGYGGHGVYLDTQTGLVDVENNLIYRVSDATVYAPGGPSQKPGNPDEANVVKNNILAYGRIGMVEQSSPYTNSNPVPTEPSQVPQAFKVTNNIMYFDRNLNSTSPFEGVAAPTPFYLPAGCTYTPFAFPLYQEYDSNLYWRTDGMFATYAPAFNVQTTLKPGPNGPCAGSRLNDSMYYTFYGFVGWQKTVGEDLHSMIRNPHFMDPVYPVDNFTLSDLSLGIDFVPFDPNQAGRYMMGPRIQAPVVPETFVTAYYNPATDY